MTISPALLPSEISIDTLCIATRLALPSGVAVMFRPLLPEDSQLLGDYFQSLSAETRQRFGPHPLDRSTADQLCATLNYAEVLRLIVVTTDQVIAYFILQLSVTEHEQRRYAERGLSLDPATDCTCAPCVADAYQAQGVGSAVMPLVVDVARRLGRRWLVLLGGTQASNQRALHFYRKHGFQTVGTFEYPAGILNEDMRLAL